MLESLRKPEWSNSIGECNNVYPEDTKIKLEETSFEVIEPDMGKKIVSIRQGYEDFVFNPDEAC